LGLWISKGIIQKYGGAIRFRSASFTGRNITCFQVRLPDADVQETRASDISVSEVIEVAEVSNGPQ
jgi:K+-sensing histidine kinase KdpD